METKGKIFSIGKNEYSYRGLNLKLEDEGKAV